MDIDFHSESLVVKAIKCLANFINKKCFNKPLNPSKHFSDFIRYKNDLLISLKDHNIRLNDCYFTPFSPII